MSQQQKQNNDIQKDLAEAKQVLQHKIDMAYVKSSGSIQKENAQCKICKFLVRQQILECPKCKQYGCAVCVQSKLNENLIQKINKCPFDNECTQSEEYKKVNNSQLETLLSSIKITCPGTQLKGQEKCTEVESLSYANCEAHFAKCLYIFRPCKICGNEIPKKFMPQHLSSECQQSLVNCDGCYQKILRKEYENHLVQCPGKIQVVCKGCRQSFAKTQIDKHEQNCDEITNVCQKCLLPIAKKDEEAHNPSTCLILKNFQLFKQEILQQVQKQQSKGDSQNQKNNQGGSGRVPIVRQNTQQNPDQILSANQLDDQNKEELKSILNEVEKTSHSQQAICSQMQSLREEVLAEIKQLNQFHYKQIESIKQQQQNDQELFRKNFEVDMHFLRDEMSQIHNQINSKTKTNPSMLLQQDLVYYNNFQKQPSINLNDSQTFLNNEFGSVYQSSKNLSGNTPRSSKYNTSSYLNPFIVKNHLPSQASYNQNSLQDNPLSLSHRYPHKENLLQNRRNSKTYSQSQKKNDLDQEQFSNSLDQNLKLNTQRGFSQKDNKEEGYRLPTKPEKRIQILDQNDNLPSINLSQRTPTQLKRKKSFVKTQLAVNYH